MPLKKYSESQFLTALLCPAYLRYDYNPYSVDIAQHIANQALIIFLNNIDEYLITLDIDNLLNKSISFAIKSNLKNKDSAFQKRLYTYSSNYILQFLKKFPPAEFYPLLTEVEVSFAGASSEVNFYYDIFLKNLQTKEIVILNFIAFEDYQIKNNLNFFYAKKYLVLDRLKLIFKDSDCKYYCYYIPKMKPTALNHSIDITFYEIIKKENTLKNLFEIFLNKMALKKNPFCLNFTCPKRKECSAHDTW